MSSSTFFDPHRLSEALALEHDTFNPGIGGSAFATHQLSLRHHRYYRARVPGLIGEAGDRVCHGPCPFCSGAFQVGLVDGWWLCTGCYRQGEAYTLEYLLEGHAGTDAWDAARKRVERMMEPTN